MSQQDDAVYAALDAVTAERTHGAYVSVSADGCSITLDGEFTAAELEAIVGVLRAPKAPA